MIPTFSERQELGKQFADHVARMQRCLQAAGKHIEPDDIVYAWVDYSDGLCAGWLALPEQDDALLAILLKHLPPSRLTWQTTVLDAVDGSGDCILPLPEELLARAGWKEGDKLSIDMTEAGTLILQRVE